MQTTIDKIAIVYAHTRPNIDRVYIYISCL